jgi:hypothetical protein
VAGIYNRSTYEREKRNALAAWADHVHANVVGAERKIIPFAAYLDEALGAQGQGHGYGADAVVADPQQGPRCAKVTLACLRKQSLS